ncbi:hypothetical protein PSTG_13603 [Puccinia striiformis f. sp. tritici PST-78]|uniref:DUF659 domain-containing protein n=1 Tax=Puccinia striiformis f. sp. tritici PST-78 TaxID=1165861 RepID=A0A0L0V192_9BASI|nr:hypothetical protein PSTG_13603 [Puccinia striiformis f. sp. tritici PST-78]
MPLNFVRLQKSHTGVYLAQTIQLIVEKFGLQDKIYGIVTDSTLNNQTMIEEIQTYRWPNFKGETTWMVLRPFGSHKKKKSTWNCESALDSDDYRSDGEEDHKDRDDQIRFNGSDDGSIINDSALAADLIYNDEVELEDDDVNDLSGEEEDN